MVDWDIVLAGFQTHLFGELIQLFSYFDQTVSSSCKNLRKGVVYVCIRSTAQEISQYECISMGEHHYLNNLELCR